jgi:hypothetical protein
MIIALIFGLLTFTKFSREYSWASRLGYAILIGTNVGLTTRTQVRSLLIQPLQNTIQKGAIFTSGDSTFMQIITAAFFILSFILALITFTYTKEVKGWYGTLSTIGRFIIVGYVGGIMPMYINTRLSVFYTMMKYIVETILSIF